MASSTLYPPILPTYQSAFVANTESCKIYFSISQYNIYSQIQNNAQVTIVDQNTNLSMLKNANGIKVCNVRIDSSKDYDQYYITISKDDLISGFEINRYYKVQIRFTDANTPSDYEVGTSNWLNEYTNYFSEWSTVCLVRAISQPSLSLKNFIQNDSIILTTSDIDVVGSLNFEDSSETDKLSSYRIKLYNQYTDDLLSDSGLLYTSSYNNVNEINYTFKYAFQDSESYKMIVDIETKNYYQQSFTYNFTIVEQKLNPISANVSAAADNDNGRVEVVIEASESEKVLANIIIRRASSRSNFTVWEDVHAESLSLESGEKYSWYDFTVESGVFYQYGVQQRDSKGRRGQLKKTDKVIPEFYDMFLNAEGQQLAIKCDQSVSSFKHNIPDNKTDTLGSKYPFIRRNGDTDYKSFSLSGMITSFNDDGNIFFSESEAYGTSVERFADYRDEQGTAPWNDAIYEREYRNKVLDFLNANTVKLLRTGTEGNILVRLMNVSLSPEDTLGRMLYSFSADAYEIAECTLENFDTYNIQPIGETSDVTVSATITKQSSITGTFTNDVFEKIIEKHQSQVSDSTQITVDNLSSVGITFEDSSYPIKETSSGLTVCEASDSNLLSYGHIVKINGIDILVTGSTYQLSDGIKIKSISFPVDTQATINYVAELIEQEKDDNKEIQKYTYSSVNGQLFGTFDYKDDVYIKIWSKYYLKQKDYYQEMIELGGIKIEANENTVVYVKSSGNDDYVKYIINNTNFLNLQDDETIIDAFYFGGIHLEESKNATQSLTASYQYYAESSSYDSLDAIPTPAENHVYTVGGVRYIWFNSAWAEMTKDDDVSTAVSALIDYNCDLVRGDYA